MKISFVLGTRPEIIKLAPVVREAQSRGHIVEITHTAQHYDLNMSEQFFSELGVVQPSHFLGVGSGTHGWQLARGVEGCESILQASQPTVVCVVGDTNAGLAGALASVKLHLPVVHFEAGVRSYDWRMPEEINRRVIDSVSTICLGPTLRACETLKFEGHGARTWYIGDTLVESVIRLSKEHARGSVSDFVLATIHRAENTDILERLKLIINALSNSSIPVVFPIHPRTRKRLEALGNVGGALALQDPVGYSSMLELIAKARAVVTDSGGVQQEASILGTPCITVRENTEWVETIEAGANRLVRPEQLAGELKAISLGLRQSDWICPFRPGASVRSMELLERLGSEGRLSLAAADYLRDGIPLPSSVLASDEDWSRRLAGGI